MTKMQTDQNQIQTVTNLRNLSKRPQVKGKFFYVGNQKLWIRGVTYGTFKPDDSGNEFNNPEIVEKDFGQMADIGINVIRIYTPPPKWLLDCALKNGLYVMVGIPWEQHITFLDNRKTIRSIKNRIRNITRSLGGHPAILCYVIGNEIPASIVRWHGRKKVERFIRSLYKIAKKEDPTGLVTYVNFPTTEYLQLSFLDFQCFNVYLEEQHRLESYIYRLHNIAGDFPLLMGEIGLDSRRNGEEKQAEAIDWQIRTAFRLGCAGAFVFSWTDEWHRGGYDIEDWDFGLTDRNRCPKKAFWSVQKAFSEVPFSTDMQWPRISVVVASYNGSNTIRECFEGLLKLDYPNFEVIVVNDGSTDETPTIAGEYDFRLINTDNQGLSNARNTGIEAATGEIVAFLDDDAYPDQDWLKYLAITFMTKDCVGVGGPNIAPLDEGKIADCIANSPGGPLHVLLSDIEAEHIPGCNMAFRTECLKAIGGFDPQFRVAGDDVDLCWRIQETGWWIAFSPAAMVWHSRRNSIRTYLKQQMGYVKAEVLLEKKWPQKYNPFCCISWKGRIYGKGLTKSYGLKKWRVYYGVWGSAPFQSLYGHRPSFLQSLTLMPEWYEVALALMLLSILGYFWKPLLIALPFLFFATACPIMNVIESIFKARYTSKPLSPYDLIKLRLLTGFLHVIQPLVRLIGRSRYGLSIWRKRTNSHLALPRPKKYEIWSDNWKAPDNWLKSFQAAMIRQGASIKCGGDFDHWDIETIGGLFGFVHSKMAIEEHGGGKQLVRFRSWPVISPFGWSMILIFAVLSVWAAADDAWGVASILIVITLGLMIQTLKDCAYANGFCQKVMSEESILNNDELNLNKKLSEKHLE